MATNYSPTIVTDGAVFVGDALMPSTATSATKLYNRAGSGDGTMYTGGCCNFDGTDDDFFTTSDITLSGAFAISVWVKGNGSSFGSGWVISNKSGGPVNLAMRLVGSPPKIQYYYYSGAWRSIYSTASVSVDTWTHLVMSRTSGNYVSFYINGELDSTTQAEDAGGVTGNTVNGPVNVVGGYWGTGVFSGSMADFKVFNTNLSSAQVKEMYDDSKVIIPNGIGLSNLDLWYSMNEGVGTIAYDGSGNKNSGIGQNFNDDEFLTGQTGCPQLIQGYNRPMLFDGTNDYVSAGNPAALKFTWADNFSLSAWIWRSSAAGSFDHIIGKTFGNYRLALNGQQLSFRLNSNGLIAASGASDIPNNTWTHVAATWATNSSDGGTAKIYINGSLNATQTGTANWTDGGADFQIGNSYGESYYFNGLINECIAYNKTLSLAEVQVLAATGPNGGPLPPDPRDLSDSSNALGYWRNDGTVSWPNLGSSANVGAGTPSGSPSALLFVEGYNGQNNTKSGRDSQGFPLKHKNVGAMGFISDCFVSVPSIGTSGEFSNCTISIWFNKQNQINNYGNLFDCNFNITDYNKGPRMEIHTDNSTIRLYLAADNGNYYSAPAGTFSNDIWTNITWKITTIGTSKQIVTPYINGVNSYEATEQTNSSYFWDGDIGALNIGRGFSTARSFTGDIGGFRIYNRGLSAAEILQNYNAQKSRFT